MDVMRLAGELINTAGSLAAMKCSRGSRHIGDLSEATQPGTQYDNVNIIGTANLMSGTYAGTGITLPGGWGIGGSW